MSTAHLVICVYHSEELLRVETEGDGEMRSKTLERKSQEIPGPLAESQGGIASTSSQMSFKGWCICKGTAYLMFIGFGVYLNLPSDFLLLLKGADPECR